MAEKATPHDRFFKRLFGDLEIAADFMQNYLPDEILARVDLTTLRLEKESFVDPALRESFSDLLFSVKLIASGEVFIYLLLEHKSAPEPFVAFQLLRYIVQFWERAGERIGDKLPMIVPIVFYHGRERWTVPRKFSGLVETGGVAEWQKYAPEFEYVLHDLSLNGGAEIAGQPKLRLGLELMRHIFSEDLGRRLPSIFRYLRELQREDALEYLRAVMAYLSGTRKRVKREEIQVAMQEVFAQEEFDKSALFIQEWMQEGREEGREEGLHTGMFSFALRLLRNLFGQVDRAEEERISALSSQQLEGLAEALLKFNSPEDLNQWLSAHPPESTAKSH